MSAVFDCLWPCFLLFQLKHPVIHLPFVLILFSPPPSFLLPLFLFCSPLSPPPPPSSTSSSSAYDHQHADGKPSSPYLLSLSLMLFFASCRTVHSFQLDPFIQFHPLTSGLPPPPFECVVLQSSIALSNLCKALNPAHYLILHALLTVESSDSPMWSVCFVVVANRLLLEFPARFRSNICLMFCLTCLCLCACVCVFVGAVLSWLVFDLLQWRNHTPDNKPGFKRNLIKD